MSGWAARLPITPVVICAAALALTYLGFTTTRYFAHTYRLHQDEARLRAEIRTLERDHDQLVAVRDYLKSDEYIEDVARRVLGLVRPGETLVVVSGLAPTPAAQAAPVPAATPGAPWWKDLFVQPAVSPLAAPPP
jgi:cell division protein FtsB